MPEIGCARLWPCLSTLIEERVCKRFQRISPSQTFNQRKLGSILKRPTTEILATTARRTGSVPCSSKVRLPSSWLQVGPHPRGLAR